MGFIVIGKTSPTSPIPIIANPTTEPLAFNFPETGIQRFPLVTVIPGIGTIKRVEHDPRRIVSQQ